MRDQMGRFVFVPFSFGCGSESSVDIATSQPTKPESGTRIQEGRESSSTEKTKTSWGLLAVLKPNLADQIYRLAKNLKSNLAQLFVYKEEKEEDMEIEMEIGFPTDVKHVTHIGWDGTTTTNPVKGWEHVAPPELVSAPSISMRQFELAMAAQADRPMCLDVLNKNKF